MRRISHLVAVALLCAAALVCTAARAEEVLLYGPGVSPGPTVSAWGSGTAQETNKDVTYINPEDKVLKIVSQGAYTGAAITLAQPLDLAAFVSDAGADAAIVLRIFPHPPQQPQATWPMAGLALPTRPGVGPQYGTSGTVGAAGTPAPGAALGPGGAMAPRLGTGAARRGRGRRSDLGQEPFSMPGFAPYGAAAIPGASGIAPAATTPGLGYQQPGPGPAATPVPGLGVPSFTPGPFPGAPGQAAGTRGYASGYYYQPPQPVTAIRVFLETEAGGLAVDNLRLNLGALDEGGWLRTEIPLSAFAGSNAARTSRLLRIAVAADTPGTFYLARVQLIGHAQPVPFEITVSPFEAGAVLRNKQVLFRALPSGDLSRADITAYWDFSDKDGVGVDAIGPEAVCAYAAAGQYRVTCTVVDLRGRHLATEKTIEITVR